MTNENLRSAGVAGAETVACKLFGDDIVEVLKVIRAVLSNLKTISTLRGQPDVEAISSILFEACFTRVVDRALTYVAGSLHAVFRKHPASAQVKEKVDITFVSGFASIDELVEAMLERRVHELSYRSLIDLDEYFQTTLKFSLFSSGSSDEQRKRAVRLVAERNLLVHNRGIVNRVFLERTHGSSLRVGDRIQYDAEAVFRELRFLLDWVCDLDIRLIEKFGLETQPRTPRENIEDV